MPYRDSVLTQILKNSLGGNTHTVVIGTLSGKYEYINETIATLNFLEVAQQVRNSKTVNAKVNENTSAMKQKL